MKTKDTATWNKVAGALYAVASSILTSALYDEIAGTSYNAESTTHGYLISSVSELGILTKLGIIGAFFAVIWGVLWFFLTFIPLLYHRTSYRNIEPCSQQQVIAEFKTAKNAIIEIQGAANLVLYADKLAAMINTLHTVFCPRRPADVQTVKAAFRTGAVTDDMADYISSYEYGAIIAELDRLVGMLRSSVDSALLRSDCDKLKNKVADLRNAAPRS